MKTARNLGFATTEELFSKMTAKQIQEWETFATIEPFPEDKIVNAIAYAASIFANGTLKKKDGSGWTMNDFLLKYFNPPKKKPKLSNMKKMFNVIGEAFGKRKINKNKEDKKEEIQLNKFRIKYKAEEFIPRRVTPPVNPVKKNKRVVRRKR